MERSPVREFWHVALIFGELAVWAMQDALMTIDDAIVELPDE